MMHTAWCTAPTHTVPAVAFTLVHTFASSRAPEKKFAITSSSHPAQAVAALSRQGTVAAIKLNDSLRICTHAYCWRDHILHTFARAELNMRWPTHESHMRLRFMSSGFPPTTANEYLFECILCFVHDVCVCVHIFFLFFYFGSSSSKRCAAQRGTQTRCA